VLFGFSPAGLFAAPPEEASLAFAHHLFSEQDYYRAITEYERFAYLYPEDPRVPDVRFQIAMCYLYGEQFDPALTRFEALSIQQAGQPLAQQSLFRMVDAYYDQKEYQHAILILQKVANEEHTTEVQDAAHIYSGLCFLRLADPELAEQEFLRIPKTSPGRPHRQRRRAGLRIRNRFDHRT